MEVVLFYRQGHVFETRTRVPMKCHAVDIISCHRPVLQKRVAPLNQVILVVIIAHQLYRWVIAAKHGAQDVSNKVAFALGCVAAPSNISEQRSESYTYDHNRKNSAIKTYTHDSHG
jgi:hypothetical protein